MPAIKFLFNFVREKPSFIITSLIFNLSSVILNYVSAIFLGSILILVLRIGNSTLLTQQPEILQKSLIVLDRFGGNEKLSVAILWFSIAVILQIITGSLSTIIDRYYEEFLLNRLRLKCISLLQAVKLNFYIKNNSEDISIRIHRELDKTVTVAVCCFNILMASLSVLIFTCCAVLVSWKLTLIVAFSIFVVESIEQFFLINSQKWHKVSVRQFQKYYDRVLDLLTGIRSIKTLGGEQFEYDAIAKTIQLKEKAQINTQISLAIVRSTNKISIILIIMMLAAIEHYLFDKQFVASIPVLSVYWVILLGILPFISQLRESKIQFDNNFSSVAIITDLLSQDNKTFLSSGTLTIGNLKSGINFQNVSFSYPDDKRLILNNINLWISQGKNTALVSASNIAKFTIGELILRFQEPNAGRILVDGQDLQEYNIASWRKAVGVLDANTFLFNNSVTYNITYGLDNITQSELITAAKKANAYEFITQLPAGFDTQIGDRGVVLSPGERQRIGIARILLRNPSFVIIHEAIDNLDLVSDRLVQNAIVELCRDRTSLIVANRLSTVQNADCIIVLDKGRVLEKGNHQELLKKDGLYARLYSMQFKDNYQSHQRRLAKKISRTLMRHNRLNLSHEIRTSLNSLLSSLQLFNDGLIESSQEQEKILDESYISAKNLLNSLKEYEQKLNRKYDEK